MSEPLGPDEQLLCLRLARQAIAHFVKTGNRRKPNIDYEILRQPRGVFVTLKVDNELRGCVGYPLPYSPLGEAIIELAIAACSEDYRFEPLKPVELNKLKIEISVLSLPEAVDDYRKIELGRHGIIISKGSQRGLLLPQVPVEHGWNLETYLSHGCLKAGLPQNEWQKGVSIEIFTAQFFSE